MKTKWFPSSLLIALFTFCCGCLLVQGETPFEFVWQGFQERIMGYSSQWNPLLDERLPRLIVILSTGASLAVSGAVMQSLFQNPLASPSILGITSGASLLVIIVYIFGLHLSYPYAIPIAAFCGSLLTLIIVYSLAKTTGNIDVGNLLLTGIAISTILIAIQGALIYALRDEWQLIQIITEWEAGSSMDRTWQHVHMQLPLTLVGLIGCWLYREEINILTLGEEEAHNLGVDVRKIRWRLFLFVSFLSAGAISSMGVIAFFGLILPHLIRKIYGPDHRSLIPQSIFWGGLSLCLLDLFLRIFSIQLFSIGNISAILGGLFFLVLLLKNQKNRYAIHC